VIVISDATPIIHLGGSGWAHLFFYLYQEVLVPQTVVAECAKHDVNISRWPYFKPVSVPVTLPAVAALDAGEREAITLAAGHANSVLLIDERKGTQVARGLGIKAIGTAGILLQAKQRGFISSVAPILMYLVAHGLHLSHDVMNEILVLAHERGPQYSRKQPQRKQAI
jgi:predicted nucleic acid-binding protein